MISKQLRSQAKALFRALRTLPPREFARRVYIQLRKNIYPIYLPDIKIESGLDFLVLEIPPRYSPMMPNGAGYVNNILKGCDINFQIVDANIVFYHRYHSRRILEKTGPITTSSGHIINEDPWHHAHVEEWSRDDVIEHFWPQFEELLTEVVSKRPKAVGFSVHASNRVVAGKVIEELRERLPDTPIVVGGYDCLYHNVGPYIFPHFDYMVIGEAELTLKPLVQALARGERPKDLVGILSRFDTPGRKWVEPPMFEELDSSGYPKYEWTDISLYRHYEGHQLVPITASRGCNWSRCRFCAECLPYKKRSPGSVVDEIEFMVSKGLYKFHFNESDVNGDPENLYNICSEIINRRLKVQLVGQLRVDRRNDRDYMKHLAKAGFTHLRFGVDGWSSNTLRLQSKGYTMKMVQQNLRDCHKAGITATVNVVLGVPGETEEDVDEMIENFILCKDYIDTVESLNTLILAAGSEYYKHPDKYKIRFHGDRDKIYGENPYFIPTELWYSEEPYIDQTVRLKRLERIVNAIRRSGFGIAPFAANVVEKLKQKPEEKAEA